MVISSIVLSVSSVHARPSVLSVEISYRTSLILCAVVFIGLDSKQIDRRGDSKNRELALIGLFCAVAL